MSDKIKVINAARGRCIINNRDLGIKRVWQSRGDVVLFTKEQIEALMYDPAFSNMVNEGYLYIEDMEVKKEIGVEPEDATTPTRILMDEKQLKRFWKDMPLSQFKIEIKNLTRQQINSLVDYAIEHGEEGSIEKANYLSTISDRNILKGIELNKQSKEA